MFDASKDLNNLINYPSFFENIKESDIEAVANSVEPLMQAKIAFTSLWLDREINGGNGSNGVFEQAFKLKAKELIKDSIYTYLSNEKWKQNISILGYVGKTISRYGFNFAKKDKGEQFKKNVHICLICKEENDETELLVKEKNEFVCLICKDKIKSNLVPSYKIDFYNKLYKHSASGVCCPICKKFVPKSLYTNGFYCCPYEDCKYVFREANKMKHPSVFVYDKTISLQKQNSDNRSVADTISIDDEYADSLLIKEQSFERKFGIIKSIIETQQRILENTKKIPIKDCMYKAFMDTLMQYPEDMSDYIIYGKNISEIPIQSAIFQNFITRLEQLLPLTVYVKGDEININYITDPALNSLIEEKSFVNFVDNNYSVRIRIDKQIEEDIEIQDTVNDAFIGKLIKITTAVGDDKIDLMPYVLNYNFRTIIFKNCKEIQKGMDVYVRYYSVYPSYSAGAMTYVQRVKKKISDSVIKRLKQV